VREPDAAMRLGAPASLGPMALAPDGRGSAGEGKKQTAARSRV